MKKLKFLVPLFLFIILVCSGCSKATYVTLNGPDTGTIGDTLTLTLSDSTLTDVTWESSNDDIATVVNGQVDCKGEGIVTITAYYNETSTYHNITISPAPIIPYITIEEIPTLTEGDSYNIVYACYNFTEQPTVTISSSDNQIVSINGTTLTALKEGSAELTVQAGSVSDTVTVSVIPQPAFSIKGATEIYTGKTWSYKVAGNVVTSWTLSDNTNAIISNKGVITVYTTEAQDLTIYATLVTGETISLKIAILDKVPEYDDSNLYVSSYLEGSLLRDSVIYNGTTYYYGYNAFYTLSQALAKAKENTTIYVGKGDYDMSDNAGDLSFSASHITLIGPNADKSATDERVGEANIYQNVRIAAKITDITFNGLNFTRNTYITCYSLNDNITFTSCLFNGSTKTPNILPNQTYAGGCIRYFYSSSNTSKGLLINNCIFSNSKEVPVVLGNVTNVVIKDNLFDTIETDAILVNPNTFNTSHTITLQNNTFKNITNRALALSQWGMASENDKDSYYIYNNTFDTVGTSGTAVIDLERYASGAASMMIIGNTFKNNAYDIKATFTLGENDVDLGLTCNYNIFLGEPDNYYINTTMDNTQLSMAYNAYYDADGQKGIMTNISAKGADTTLALSKDQVASTPLVSYNALILESEAGLTINGVDSLTSTNTSIVTVSSKTLKPVAVGLVEVKYTVDNQEGSLFIFVKKYLGVDYIKAFVEMALSQ